MSPAKPLAAVLLASACSMAACAQIVGIDEWDPEGAATATSSASGTGATTTSTGSASTVTGTGGATTTTTTGTGGATTGTGGAGGGELCDNGIDDDGDDLIDCDDPACDAYTCVEDAPIGWVGPAAAQFDVLTATCDPTYKDEIAKGGTGAVVAPPATCGACTCAAATGTCTAPDANISTGSFCGDGLTMQLVGNGTVCTDTPPFGFYQFVNGDPPFIANGGSCSPSGGIVAVRPPVFATESAVCGAPVGACGSTGQVCAPKPVAPLHGFCITQNGDTSCPAGPYSEKTVVFTSIQDERACTTCQCGAPTGALCGGKTELYSDDACSVLVGTAEHSIASLCDALTGTIESVKYIPVAAGMCAPSGGAPKGNATAATPVTVCCTP